MHERASVEPSDIRVTDTRAVTRWFRSAPRLLARWHRSLSFRFTGSVVSGGKKQCCNGWPL